MHSICPPTSLLVSEGTWAEPDLLTYRRAEVRVVTGNASEAGRTVARYGDGPVRVATGVDVDSAKSLMSSLLGESVWG